ncbi:hypothetical protein F5Y05DRAFT_127974 [Hypoxylon sp. FL0543]|nr:hypothetical protein F5Y05DRAFT_127974 [Hypoxylon sp. FL0543]
MHWIFIAWLLICLYKNLYPRVYLFQVLIFTGWQWLIDRWRSLVPMKTTLLNNRPAWLAKNNAAVLKNAVGLIPVPRNTSYLRLGTGLS